MISPEHEEPLLARLLDVPLAERAEYLRRACLDEPALRECLQQIAQAVSACEAETRAAPLPASDSERVRALELAFDTRESGTTVIGPYKLLQKIGEGGFGVVWMAEQQSPVRRRVALKIIKSGMDTREVIARFEAERQALALMDHPNIARVFDAGATDVGQPYFVMELVRGIPITKYCDENRVPTEARLQLFILVCHAVQHAHQKGIIHRDLKPSNILVTMNDGVPIPKIIDFGIAKAIEGRLTEKTLFTQFHAFIGTPAYTSPEQMEMSGLDVDTRSDIYSLGILLYELLAGRPPFDPDELLKSGLEEMRRTIREVDPLRPSLRLRTFSDELRTTVAQQRGTDAGKLSLVLRGDLDWVVMRCLEKDRTRRYDTANALADDIGHYLNDETVSARPPSTSDRLQKFIRRHRLGFAAGTAIALSLIAGLVVASVLLVREHKARERAVAAEATEIRLRQDAEQAGVREAALRAGAEAKASQARVSAATSEQVAQFMTDMLGSVAPSVALGRDTILLREVLDKTTQRLDTELKNQPAVSARLRATLGAVYRDLGQFAKAEPLLRSAITTYRTLPGDYEKELGTCLHNLGDVLSRLRRNAEAEVILREALEIRRRVLGAEHVDIASTLYVLSAPLRNLGHFGEYESLRRESLAMRRKLLGNEHPDVALSLFGLGTVAREKGDLEEAESLFRESLAIRRKALSNEHPDVADTLNSLGLVLQYRSNLTDAIAAFREALAIRRRVLGEAHPDACVPLMRLVGLLAVVGRREEAIAIARDALTRQRKALGDDALETAPTLLALAALIGHENPSTAEPQELIQSARRILERDRVMGTRLSYEARVAMETFIFTTFSIGDPKDGVVMAEEVYKTTESLYGPDSIETSSNALSLAMTQLESSNYPEATRLFEQLRDHFWPLSEGHRKATKLSEQFQEYQDHISGGRRGLPQILLGLGVAYRETGRLADSRRVVDEALSLQKWNTDVNKRPIQFMTSIRYELGFALNRHARFEEAEPIFRQALLCYDLDKIKTPRPRSQPRARAESGLGTSLAGQGKFTEAEPLVIHAFQELKANESSGNANTPAMVREAFEAIVALYTSWGKPGKITEWCEKFPELKINAATAPSGSRESSHE